MISNQVQKLTVRMRFRRKFIDNVWDTGSMKNYVDASLIPPNVMMPLEDEFACILGNGQMIYPIGEVKVHFSTASGTQLVSLLVVEDLVLPIIIGYKR